MKVKIGLTSEQTEKLSNNLTKILANNYALYFLTLHAHWNMEDPRFFFLHELLEKQYLTLAESGDDIAERIRVMGHTAPGSIKTLANESDLPDMPENASADVMIDHLAICHEGAFVALRKLSEVGEEAKDYGLVDLLGTMVREHEKTAWLLRSHLKG